MNATAPLRLSAVTLVALAALAAPAFAQARFRTAGGERPAAPPSGSAEALCIGESVALESKVLDEERRLRVYLPPSYARTNDAYPVFYVLDGEVQFLPVASIVQQLATGISTPLVPEAIVVAIHNTDRERDLRTPTLGGDHGGKRFLRFLTDELLPYVDANYRTQPCQALIGHSQGASFATWVLAVRPDTFRFYLTIDPPLHLTPGLIERVGDVMGRAENTRRLVTCERSLGWFRDFDALASRVAPHAYVDRIELGDDVDHETMVVPSLFRGFQSLFHDLVLDDSRVLGLDEMRAHFDHLSRVFGYPLKPTDGALTMAAAMQVLQGCGHEALAFYAWRDELFGEPRLAGHQAMMRARARELADAGPDRDWSELYAQLELPPPSVEEMEPFLGEWVGRVDVPHGTPYDLEASFRVQDGAVVAHSRAIFPGGQSFEDPPGFVRVLEDGALRWGARSSRGAGLRTVTLRLEGKELVGLSETLGVVPLPELTDVMVPSPVRMRRR